MSTTVLEPRAARPHVPVRWVGGSGALVATAVLFVVSTVLQPTPVSGSAAAKLAALDADGVRATVSAVAFVAAQLPQIAALLAIGRLIHDRCPRLAATGVALGVAGAFGESVAGGMSLTWIVMSHDEARRSAYAALLGQLQSSPLMTFALVALVGSVLGLLLLSIGLHRSRVAPRWVAPALWAFLLLEYVGSSLVPALGYLAVAAAAAAFVALAREVVRRPAPAL